MKLRNLFWTGVLLLTLFACSDPDISVETETRLKFTVPLISTELKNYDTSTEYFFSGYTKFCLANKDNAQDCPDNILHVTAGTGSQLILPVFAGEVNFLKIEWGYSDLGSDVYDMQDPILLSSGNLSGEQAIQINLDKALQPVINKINSNTSAYFKLIISGNTNHFISSAAQITIPIIVEYEALTPRFTL